MPWRGPNYPGEFPSLGWGVIAWCERYLRIPDGDLRGEPWIFTGQQTSFIVRLFRVQRPYGLNLHYRRAARIAPKGTGKSPLGAALALAAVGAPIVPDGFDAAGEPVGRPQATPVVQIAGVSEDQADNVYDLVLQMCALGDLDDAIPGIDVGATRTLLPDGGSITPVSSAAASREGQRVTFGVFEETQWWRQSNGGIRMAGVMRRNVGKMNGLTVELSNAPEPGGNSVCEKTIVSYRKGETEGVLLDYKEPSRAYDWDDDNELRELLAEVYGDTDAKQGGWVDLDRVFREIRDPETDKADAQRYYGNIMAAGSGQWMEPEVWKARADSKIYVQAGEKITMGFDGSRTSDSTVLRACRISDGHLFTLGIWERPTNLEPGEHWEVPRAEVMSAVKMAMTTYKVIRFYADPPWWQSEVDFWSSEWPDVVFQWQTNRDTPMAAALHRLHSDVTNGLLTHDGDERVALHYGNAFKRIKGVAEKPLVLVKKESPTSMRKIDAVVTDALAYEARGDAIADGLPEDVPDDYYTMYLV